MKNHLFFKNWVNVFYRNEQIYFILFVLFSFTCVSLFGCSLSWVNVTMLSVISTPMLFETINKPVRTEVKLITPELAKQWLTVNTINRKPSKAAIKYYANEMKLGHWGLNGESIIFSNTHKLLDGQQRLMACVMTGISFESVVVYNVIESNFGTIDTGKKRTVSDYLSSMGIPDYPVLAAGIKKFISIKLGYSSRGINANTAGSTELFYSPDTALEIYHNSPEFFKDVIRLANKFYKKFRILKKSDYFGFISYLVLVRKHDITKVVLFFELLCDINIDISFLTISILRQKLYESEFSKRPLRGNERDALIIKTWNAYVTGKPIKKLNYGSAEDYPKFL